MDNLVSKKYVLEKVSHLIKECELKKKFYHDKYLEQLISMNNTIKINDDYIHKLVVLLTRQDEKLSLLIQIKKELEEVL